MFKAILLTFSMLCASAHASLILTTSPTGAGALGAAVPEFGGAVVDIVGNNNSRIVGYIGESDLFYGTVITDTNGFAVQQIGELSFSQKMLDMLMGGITKLAIRLTAWDGDNALRDGLDVLSGEYQANENFLSVNGVNLGSFSTVQTEAFTRNGETNLTEKGVSGFGNNVTAVGWFSSTNLLELSSIYDSIIGTGSLNLSFVVEGAKAEQRNFISFSERFAELERQAKSFTVTSVNEPQTIMVLLLAIAAFFTMRSSRLKQQPTP